MLGACRSAEIAAAKPEPKFIWSYLAHFGVNSWKDIPLDRAPADASRSFKVRCMADYLRTDEKVWRAYTDALGKSGANMIIIDMAEGVFLPFGITEDDAADGVRVGGFGSTDRGK